VGNPATALKRLGAMDKCLDFRVGFLSSPFKGVFTRVNAPAPLKDGGEKHENKRHTCKTQCSENP